MNLQTASFGTLLFNLFIIIILFFLMKIVVKFLKHKIDITDKNRKQDIQINTKVKNLCAECKSPNTKKLTECEYCDANLEID